MTVHDDIKKGEKLKSQTMGHSEVTHRQKPSHTDQGQNAPRTDKGTWGDQEASPGTGTASNGTK